MPGFPVPFIKFREDTANGFPLAGGQLWSYEAGTGTPLPTYTTQALDVPNSNPVILDASGRASIFIEDGVGYKFILADALGNTIWTEDDIQVPKVPDAPLPAVVPVGAIVAYGGDLTPPNGWFFCDGATYSSVDYKALSDVIGLKYGGTGTMFKVPDLQQRFPLGKAATGDASGLGNTGGTFKHRHTGGEHKHGLDPHTHKLPVHNHRVLRHWPAGQLVTTIDANQENIVTTAQSGNQNIWIPATDDKTTELNGDGDVTVEAAVPPFIETKLGGGAVETSESDPPYLVVNWIIKY